MSDVPREMLTTWPFVAVDGQLCKNCGTRPGTETWIGEADTLTWARSGGRCGVLWCKRCVLVAQIDYAERLAAALPELRRLLAAESGE